MLEETGYRARTLRPLFHFYASPGFLSERMFLFEARGLSGSKAQPERDERIRAVDRIPVRFRKQTTTGNRNATKHDHAMVFSQQ